MLRNGRSFAAWSIALINAHAPKSGHSPTAYRALGRNVTSNVRREPRTLAKATFAAQAARGVPAIWRGRISNALYGQADTKNPKTVKADRAQARRGRRVKVVALRQRACEPYLRRCTKIETGGGLRVAIRKAGPNLEIDPLRLDHYRLPKRFSCASRSTISRRRLWVARSKRIALPDVARFKSDLEPLGALG